MSLGVILILNSIILIALASINNVWGKKSDSKKTHVVLSYGVLFGGCLILLMNLAWGTETGVFYDSRTILIAVVASIYSIYVTIIMVVIGVVYRLYLSGAGAVAGVITIVSTGVLGILFKKYILPKVKLHFHLSYLVYGLVVHIFMLLYHFALPLEMDFILNRIKIISPIVLTVYPVMVVVLVIIVKSNDRRLSSAQNLAESENNYDILFNNFTSGVLYFDKEGIIVKCNDRFSAIMNAAKDRLIGLDMNILPNQEFQKVFQEVMKGTPSVFHDEYTSYLSGKELFLNVDFKPAYKDGVFVGGIGIIDDLTESEALKKDMINALTKDQLTGLNNRKLFEDDMRSTKFDDLFPIEFLMISIDNIQFYIDTMGYTKTDLIIKTVSELICDSFENCINIYRFSLNDFAIIYTIENKMKVKQALAQLERKVRSLKLATPAVSYTSSNLEMDKESDWYDTTNALRNRIYTSRTYTKSQVTKNSIDVLLASLFEKSPQERSHSERVSTLSVQLAKQLNASKETISRLRLASVLHDIGKLNVESRILEKTGKLTDDEYKTIQSHTESGFRILSAVKEYEDLARIVLAHHERYDGEGYPFGIKNEDIPFESKIISVVDAYDAMINDRPYRKALTNKEAIQELKENSGTQFDPEIANEFIKWLTS